VEEAPIEPGAHLGQDAPVTRKVDVVDVLHGTPVPDPYRGLDDADADEVRAWTQELNA
jgi:prolyl oligopeptidase